MVPKCRLKIKFPSLLHLVPGRRNVDHHPLAAQNVQHKMMERMIMTMKKKSQTRRQRPRSR
jgi:hypothetical protein